MSPSQEFDTNVSNADFLSADWRIEHCDPEKWEKPSTHDIPGVELVGDPHMKLWSETNLGLILDVRTSSNLQLFTFLIGLQLRGLFLVVLSTMM